MARHEELRPCWSGWPRRLDRDPRAASVFAFGLAVALAGCGARTELDAPGKEQGGGGGPTHDHSRIGLLGTAGPMDVSSLLAFLEQRGSVTRIQSEGAPLTADELAAFDIVILDELVRDYTPQEAHVFERWVAAGGGALSLTGYRNDADDTNRPNSLLVDVGMSYEQPLLSVDYNGAVMSFADHPLTKGLSGVVFFGGYAVAHTLPATDVAFDKDKTVAAAADHGAGRVYVWGDEWVEYTQEWSDPQTPLFWSDALSWLRHED